MVLILLPLWRQPRARLIYVTSRTILPRSSITASIFFPASSQAMRGNYFPAFTHGWLSAATQ